MTDRGEHDRARWGLVRPMLDVRHVERWLLQEGPDAPSRARMEVEGSERSVRISRCVGANREDLRRVRQRL